MKLNMSITRSLVPALVFLWLAVASWLTTPQAGLAQTPAQRQTEGTAVILTATSGNVNEPGSAVKINILRWSTDEERNQLVASMNPPPPATAPAGAAAGDGGGPPRGGRGGAPRGGRGDAPAPAAFDPIVSLTAAIGKGATAGYLWTNEVAGYSIRYAYRVSLPDGGERIILATDRRLGAFTAAWKPAAPATLTDYPFTLIEVRLDSKGVGEGKTSLTTKVIVDNEAKTLALDNYAATSAILMNVKR
jgi:hypothetical protein